MTTIKFTREKLLTMLSLVSPYLNAKNKALSFSIQDGNLKMFTSDFIDGRQSGAAILPVSTALDQIVSLQNHSIA